MQAAKQTHLVRNHCDAPSIGCRRQRGQGKSHTEGRVAGGVARNFQARERKRQVRYSIVCLPATDNNSIPGRPGKYA